MSAALAITMTLTAYTDGDPGMRGDGVMASGLNTFDGAAACGPAFDFGTVFVVPVLGRRFVCWDRGSAIGYRNLDIWMYDRSAALEFGVFQAEVVVWPERRFERIGSGQPGHIR